MGIRNTLKKFGRKKACTWNGPHRKHLKRIANKAMRKFKLKEDNDV